MMNKDVQKAIYLEQASICQHLFDKGLVTWADPTKKRSFSNLQFTEKYYEVTDQIKITDEEWTALKELEWKFKSPKATVLAKLSKWLIANDKYTLTDVVEACEQYLAYCNDESKFPKSLSNFISFTEKTTKASSSQLTLWVKFLKGEVELEAIA